MKLFKNWSINKNARAMKSISKNSNCDLDLDPRDLKRKLVLSIFTPNISVKLYLNWLPNRVTRVITKGEHTYIRTYEHT